MITTAEFALNGLLRAALEESHLDLERIGNLLDEIEIAGVQLDKTTLEFTLRKNLERESDRFFENSMDVELLERFRKSVANAVSLPFPLNLWSIQNKCYEVMSRWYTAMRERASSTGDVKAKDWVEQFEQ